MQMQPVTGKPGGGLFFALYMNIAHVLHRLQAFAAGCGAIAAMIGPAQALQDVCNACKGLMFSGVFRATVEK